MSDNLYIDDKGEIRLLDADSEQMVTVIFEGIAMPPGDMIAERIGGGPGIVNRIWRRLRPGLAAEAGIRRLLAERDEARAVAKSGHRQFRMVIREGIPPALSMVLDQEERRFSWIQGRD